MPAVIKGLAQTRAALRKLEPDLLKESDRQMRAVLQVIVVEARGFLPASSPLRNWSTTEKGNKINKSTSMFSNSSWARLAFNPQTARAGIRSKIGRGRHNQGGFKSVYAILNTSPSGVIYETAGRKTKGSQGKSNNPNAGAQFIDAIQKQSSQREPHGKKEGRVAYAAVEKNNGKAIQAIQTSVIEASRLLQSRINARGAFGGE